MRRKDLRTMVLAMALTLGLGLMLSCGSGDSGGGGGGGGGGRLSGKVCTTSGNTECSGGGYVTCILNNMGDAWNWSPQQTCQAGESCVDGVCTGAGQTELFTMVVNIANIHQINHAFHAQAPLPSGTYTVAWKSGGIWGGATHDYANYMPMFVLVGADSSKRGYYLLKNPGDSFTVTTNAPDNIWVWHVDTNCGDNVNDGAGVTISISGQPDLVATASQCDSFGSFAGFAQHALDTGSYGIQWKSGGISVGSDTSAYVPIVVFVSEDYALKSYFMLGDQGSIFQTTQVRNGAIYAWYMDTDLTLNTGSVTISVLQ